MDLPANPIRLCVIGNSHVASLKLGWDKMATLHPDVRVTFFGARGGSLKELEFRHDHFEARTEHVRSQLKATSGGLTDIFPDAYDVFVLHGLEIRFDAVVNAYLDSKERNPDAVDVASRLDRTLAFSLARTLEGCGSRVILSPQPFVSERAVNGRLPAYQKWAALLDGSGNLPSDIEQLLRAWTHCTSRFPVVHQPAETVRNGIFTQERFCSNSVRLTSDFDELHNKNDVLHMNADYGVLVMQNIIAACRDASFSRIPQGNRSTSHQGARHHPYEGRPDHAYWRRAVSHVPPLEITDWYRKKFDIGSRAIATAGSCFAQHIGRRLRQQGFHYLDVEPPPAGLAPENRQQNGYGLYSARYGNVYTARQLRQLLESALGKFVPVDRAWEKDGGYVDPFRPTIQPQPYGSVEEVEQSRRQHLCAVRELFTRADIFVFTLGLTETWESVRDGAVFPVAPGVSGGVFDPSRYRFRNMTFKEVLQDMRRFLDLARELNPKMKFLLTVSPVPLAATASEQQVVVATSYSKSVLRAVAGQLAEHRNHVDYFPSFEIINSHVMGGRFFEDDMRSVRENGVDHVMRQFFREHSPPLPDSAHDPEDEGDIHCDEEMLAAFGPS